MNKRLRMMLCFAGFTLVVFAMSCGSTASIQPVIIAAPALTPEPIVHRSPQEQLTAGLKVYNDHYCATCHALDADDAHSTFGPTHNHLATTAVQRIHDPHYTGMAKTGEEYIQESITNPKAYIVSGYENTNMPMPAIPLTQAEVDALVQMLMLQK